MHLLAFKYLCLSDLSEKEGLTNELCIGGPQEGTKKVGRRELPASRVFRISHMFLHLIM